MSDPAWGKAFEIDLNSSINVDSVNQDIKPIESGQPHIANNGIIKDGGLSELYETTQTQTSLQLAYGSTSPWVYKASNGKTITIAQKAVNSDNSIIYVDNQFCAETSSMFFNRGLIRPSKYYDIVLDSDGLNMLGLWVDKSYASSISSTLNLNFYIDKISISSRTLISTLNLGTVSYSAVTPILYARIVRANALSYNNIYLTSGIMFTDTFSRINYLIGGTSYQQNILATAKNFTCYYHAGTTIFSAAGGLYTWNYPYSAITRQSGTDIIGQIGHGAPLNPASTSLVLYAFDSGTSTSAPLTAAGTNGIKNISITINSSGAVSISTTSNGILLTSPTGIYPYAITPFGGSGQYTSATATQKSEFINNVAQVLAVTPAARNPEAQSFINNDLNFMIKPNNVNLGGFLSYVSINGINSLMTITSSSSDLGAAINEFGDLPSNSVSALSDLNTIPPDFRNYVSGASNSSWLIYQRNDGRFVLVEFYSIFNQSPKFTEIAPGVVSLNACSGFNSIIDTNETIAYNNYSASSPTIVSPNTSFSGTIQSGIGVYNKYSSSIFNNTFLSNGVSTGLFLGAWRTADQYFLYYSSGLAYSNSLIPSGGANGVTLIDTDKVGTLYSNTNIVPPAGDSSFAGGGITMLTTSAIQHPNFFGYQLTNLIGSFMPPVFGGSQGNYTNTALTFFRLFGQIYGFDNNNIYAISLSGGSTGTLTGSPTLVAIANGLQYLCASPTEAIFLSSFDNSIWSFNGGRDVTKRQAFNQEPTIISGAYNVRDNSLYLLTASSIITVRDSLITSNALPVGITASTTTLQSTASGIFFVTSNQYTTRTYSQLTNSTPVNLIYQSPYYGIQLGKAMMLQRLVVHISFSAAQQTNLRFTWNYKTSDACGTITANAVIQDPTTPTTQGLSIQYRLSGATESYAFIEWIPESKYVIGGSIGIQNTTTGQTQKITVLDIIPYFTNDQDEPISGKVFAGSQTFNLIDNFQNQLVDNNANTLIGVF